MQLHLNYNPPINKRKISHQDEVLFIGSCFSEHISKRLIDLKFKVDSNPYGIVFNPASIELLLNRIIAKNYFNETDVFEKDGSWFTLQAHSSIRQTTKQELLEALNLTLNEWHKKLQTADFLIITFGSAFVYRGKQKNEFVTNCHKLPASQFEKELLENNVIVPAYNALIERLKLFNSKLQLLFTVSPVKHLRDGVVENTLSKAILIQAVHHIVKQHSNCFYFPAYELVNDDLRDYRFYEADMAHPNKQAIDYVWQKFANVFFTEETQNINSNLSEITQAYAHRPFNDNSEAHLKFKKNYFLKCSELTKKYTWLDLREEVNYFSK